MKSSSHSSMFVPNWQSPANVGACQSTRCEGASLAPYSSFNLGLHVGDDPLKVLKNRAHLDSLLPNPARYVQQVHGTDIHIVNDESSTDTVIADGLFTNLVGQPLAIMTADCLPVLLASKDGTEVAALHCGWRSLAGGIIEKALPLFQSKPSLIAAWLGPAIGPMAFEVGVEVRAQFLASSAEHELAFKKHRDKYLADLALIATQKLNRLGVKAVSNQSECTYTLNDKYFSYRRDGETGRMASVIWRKF
ncbi:peptidoglycan editing factor PgeF [Pseudoalteromonas sp. YIC-656]|uniref:peptidoglycan editing factor PgeF n=1 Tax=Pseudoalteromonas pernae TaxID=3118054 RepID=UPI00324213B3